jgi:putative transposase
LKKEGIKHILSKVNHPQTNGKTERWFRTYAENRSQFRSFEERRLWYNNRIHLGLDRKKGVTPNEAVLSKLRTESLIGLFFRRVD